MTANRPLGEVYAEAEMVAELERRGYIVRHKSEARRILSWHRVEPSPKAVVFEKEARDKLAAQITQEHIRYETRQTSDGKAVRSAFLRLL